MLSIYIYNCISINLVVIHSWYQARRSVQTYFLTESNTIALLLASFFSLRTSANCEEYKRLVQGLRQAGQRLGGNLAHGSKVVSIYGFGAMEETPDVTL